jgi:hypothetical protein
MFASVLRSMPKHHPSLSSFPAQRNVAEQALAHAGFASQMQDFGEAERIAASVLKAQRICVDADRIYARSCRR